MQDINKGAKAVKENASLTSNMFEHTFRPKQTRNSNAI